MNLPQRSLHCARRPGRLSRRRTVRGGPSPPTVIPPSRGRLSSSMDARVAPQAGHRCRAKAPAQRHPASMPSKGRDRALAGSESCQTVRGRGGRAPSARPPRQLPLPLLLPRQSRKCFAIPAYVAGRMPSAEAHTRPRSRREMAGVASGRHCSPRRQDRARSPRGWSKYCTRLETS